MSAETNQIVIIDDDQDYRNLLSRKLHRLFPDKLFDEIDPKKNSLPGEDYDWDAIELIILDFDFGLDYTGLDWFKNFVPEEMPATILMTAHGSEEIAIKAIKMGIDDYIVKGGFTDDELKDAIAGCISSKREEREKLFELKNRSSVFEKSAFINKLHLITDKKDIKNNLLLINPVAYRQIGENSGIHYQDSYIKYVTDHIIDYLSQNNISMNIFIYREEYIAVIFETDNCEKNVRDICENLQNEKFTIGLKNYPCSVNVGVISPRHFEDSEFNKNDYELLSTAHFLCKSAKADDEKNVYHYGDINVKEIETDSGSQQVIKLKQEFDIERAIEDGRISANYQPWVYILSDDKANIKDIYDVRVEFVDTRGNKIIQQKLYKILDNVFS
ncbi:MAG: response regulator, partial [Nitrososphaeraceae archaeon]|nr:response regulator [Nitrososphaeraceae archaeon]